MGETYDNISIKLFLEINENKNFKAKGYEA